MLRSVPLTRSSFFVILLLACAFLIVFTGVEYQQSQAVRHSSGWVVHSYDVLQRTRSLLSHVTDIETGQRGYILTGSPEFLAPYTQAMRELDKDLTGLDSPLENPQQQQILSSLRDNVQALKETLSTQIEKIQSQTQGPVTVNDLKSGKQVMDAVRADVNNFMRMETTFLRGRIDEWMAEQKRYEYILFSGALLGLIILGVTSGVIMGLMARSRAAERSLQESEERFRLVMHGVNDGLYDYNLEEGTVYYSPSYKEMLGYSEEEFPNSFEAFKPLLHPEDASVAWDNFRHYRARKIPSYCNIFRVRHKDGSWRWVMARGVGLWNEKGRMQRFIGTHTDITAQKEREEELKRLNADLEEVTSIVSHDLRTPLVNIKGFTEEIEYHLAQAKLLQAHAQIQMAEKERGAFAKIFESDIPEAIGFIHRSIAKMDKLTSTILNFSRNGQRSYVVESVDTQKLIQHCLDGLAYEIGAKKAEIVCAPLPVVESDAQALEQIFANLLDNAVKYLDPVRTGKITIEARILPRQTLFIIQDNGRGIARPEHSKVFDIFRRAPNTAFVRGSGMGLAFVKSAVRKLGGEIWFDSELGKGTIFYLSLPIPVQAQRKAA